MIGNSSTLTSDEFVLPRPEFHLDPPEVSPFVAMVPSTVTRDENSFDLNWVENSFEPATARAERILDDILGRSERDVQRFPNVAQVHANLGVALLNRGRLEEASNEFVAALKLSPRHFMSLANLARIRTLQGQFIEAENLYEELSVYHSGEISPLVNLAYIALRREDLGRAFSILEKAISRDSDAILPRYLMAVILLKVGRPREAIGHLRVASKSDIRSLAVHQALGVAFMMAGEAKRAVRSFKAALALAPDKQNAVRALSNVLLQHRQFEALSELLEAYLEKTPDDTVARELLGESFLAQGVYPTARKHFASAFRSIEARTTPGEEIHKARLINNIGVCRDFEADLELAAQCFLRSIELDPAFSNVAHLNLARVRIREGSLDQASKILEICRERAPENHQTPELQAFVLEKQKRYNEAIQLLISEIHTGHATEGGYGYLSGLLTDVKHDFDSACKIATEGLERYPVSVLLHNNLAYSLLMDGQTARARQVLESIPRGVRMNRSDLPTVVAATWGLLYVWEGEIEKGKEQYRVAELLANETRQRELPPIVRQKMHLELARAYIRQGDIGAARIEVSRGLSVRNGRDIYAQDLESLRDHVEKSAREILGTS
jgi:tetratricopeptide (TPR) repeat protein